MSIGDLRVLAAIQSAVEPLQLEITRLRARRDRLLAEIELIAPGPSDHLGVSERTIGFRDGWNAVRSLVIGRVKAIIEAEREP